MTAQCRNRAGFTLVELLVVVAIIAVVAGIVLTSAEPQLHAQIRATAERLAADVAYCRGLAVMNNSSYRLTFDMDNNRYSLSHTGTISALDALPDSPFRRPEDPPEEHVVDLSDDDGVGAGGVSLSAVAVGEVVATTTEVLDFGPLGETSNSEATIIWLTAGAGTAQRYIAVLVDPVTGLAWVGDLQAEGPADDAFSLPIDLEGSFLTTGS